MGRRALGLLITALVLLGCAGVVWFLLRQHHVDRAAGWAGIIGLLALPLAVWAIWIGLHSPQESSRQQPQVQVNRASIGGVVNAIQGYGTQTIRQHSAYQAAPAANADDAQSPT